MSRTKRRRRYPDVHAIGPGRQSRYRPEEDWRERHARRLTQASECEAHVRRWCEQRGVALRLGNEGHHWQFTAGGRTAEWWPSTAKLVLDKRYWEGWHVHDWEQLVAVLRKHWLG